MGLTFVPAYDRCEISSLPLCHPTMLLAPSTFASLALVALVALTPLSAHAQSSPPVTGDPAVQHVHLEPGWNWVGLRVLPSDPAFANLFGAALPHIVLVKDGMGYAYSPHHGIEDIESWDWDEGYMVYADTAVAFDVEGPAIVPSDSPIELTAGWSLTPYLHASAVPVETALASLTDYLEFARDGWGRHYIPGDPASTLDSLHSGQAYQVRLNQDETLIFPPSSGNAAPIAGFTFSCSSLSCSFVDVSTDPDGTIAAYAWTFGDGSATNTNGTPSHTYDAAGSYTVQLEVTDDDGATDSHEAQVTVTAGSQGFYGSEEVPWGPESVLYAATYNDACPAGEVYDGATCTSVEAWLASEGFTSFCYVDEDAPPSGTTGTMVDPHDTIAECGYARGQATIVHEGIYRENVRPTTSHFAFVAYPGEHPIVSGADLVTPGGWTSQGGGIWKHNWVWAAQDNNNGADGVGRRRELLVIDGTMLFRLGGSVLPNIGEGQFWVEGPPHAPTAVYVNPPEDVNPNTATVEVGQRWQLFWPADVGNHQCQNSSQSDHLVAGMTFRYGTSNRQQFSVCLGDSDGTMLDSDVSWQNAGPLDLDGVAHVIQGNHFSHNGIEGPGGTHADNGLFAFNEVRGNGWQNPTGGGHGGGGKFTRTSGLVIRNNIYADNYINGLWFDVTNRHIVVNANLFDRNFKSGVFFELFGDSSLVANNYCVENKLDPDENQNNARLMSCIKIVNSSGVVVAHNTVVNAENAALSIRADNRSLWPCDHDGDPSCGTHEARSGKNRYPADPDGSPKRARDTYVLNNILITKDVAPYVNAHGETVNPRANSIWIGAVGHDDEQSEVMRGNLSWDKELTSANKYTFDTQPSGVRTNDYAMWIANVNDRGSALFTDPLRVLSDTTTVEGMLTLAPGSPALNAGSPIPAGAYDIFTGSVIEEVGAYCLTHDAWGRPRGAVPDVGAVEAE